MTHDRSTRFRLSLLGRLARDKRGNVLAMSAAAIFPMLAVIGGAIDASRLYMARTRLQQACDAGALAGRKAMADVQTLSSSEQRIARDFFDFNFPSRIYSSTNVVRSFVRGTTPGVVAGTASVDMPTTIMKLFGYETVPLQVSCESTLLIPNTDVMFVLDVTGSMDRSAGTDSGSKMDGLKQAVKDFFAALGPGAASGPGRIRYGFVPYSVNVNVGRLLYSASPDYIVGGRGSESWTYQSREADYSTQYEASYGSVVYSVDSRSYSWSGYDNSSSAPSGYQTSYSGRSNCNDLSPPLGFRLDQNSPLNEINREDVSYPDNEQTIDYKTTTSGYWIQYRYSYNSGNRTCTLQSRSARFVSGNPAIGTRSVTWSVSNFRWIYKQRSYDVSPFVRNTSAAANPAYASGQSSSVNNGAPSTFAWNGCIEESRTNNGITASSSLTPPSDADDLDIDLIPSSTANRWKPFLSQVEYDRDGTWLHKSSSCPREASRLTQYTSDYNATTKSSTAFNSYVDSLQPNGNTYHDIGLIWGARFLSPDGIFAASNQDSAAPAGAQVNRHIVFMTDGDIQTDPEQYDPWGVTKLDGRAAPTNVSGTRYDDSHARRTDIICDQMKGKGFTVWVVGFGMSNISATLTQCATDENHAKTAANSAQLRELFSQIARSIGGLRLSS